MRSESTDEQNGNRIRCNIELRFSFGPLPWRRRSVTLRIDPQRYMDQLRSQRNRATKAIAEVFAVGSRHCSDHANHGTGSADQGVMMLEGRSDEVVQKMHGTRRAEGMRHAR